MIKCMVTKALQREAEKKMEESKNTLIYAGVVALAGVGVYFSYKAIKNYIYDKSIEEDLRYLKSFEEDIEEDYAKHKNEDEELKEKVDEFNSRRLNFENDEIVSPKELGHYIDQTKVNKDDIDLDKSDFEEDEYDKYDE